MVVVLGFFLSAGDLVNLHLAGQMAFGINKLLREPNGITHINKITQVYENLYDNSWLGKH